MCRAAGQPERRGRGVPRSVRGCPCGDEASLQGSALGAPSARAPAAASSRRVSGAAIRPPRGGLGGGKEGAGLAARDLEGHPAASHSPAQARPLPRERGAISSLARGRSARRERRVARAAPASRAASPGGPVPPASPPQGSPEGQPGAGRQARHGGRSRQAPPQQHSRRHLAPAASLLGRGLRPRPLAGSAACACAPGAAPGPPSRPHS